MGEGISHIVALRHGREYFACPVMYDASYLVTEVWFMSPYLSNVIFIYWQFYYTSISARYTCSITFSLILGKSILFMAFQRILSRIQPQKFDRMVLVNNVPLPLIYDIYLVQTNFNAFLLHELILCFTPIFPIILVWIFYYWASLLSMWYFFY